MANQEISLVGVSATSLNIIPTLKDKESIILNEKDICNCIMFYNIFVF